MPCVLITGANRGIGFAFARAYLADGWKVFATFRNPETGQRLREIEHENLVLVPLEVTSLESINACLETVRKHTERLDLLINNAGTFQRSQSFLGLRADAMLEGFAVNAIAPIIVAQQFAPLLRGGKIVNITMPTRPIGQLHRTTDHAFVAARYALNALTRMMALELVASGTVAVALWPGYLRTDMNNMAAAATPPEEAMPGLLEVIRNLTPDHAGQCILADGTSSDG